MSDKFISIEAIARRFPAPGGDTTIFENLWLSVARGEFVCVIGHSGCGKTTVLNILAGLDASSEGTVIVDGQAIEGPSLDRAVIFQSHALLPWRTVIGNVGYAVSSRHRKWNSAQVPMGRAVAPICTSIGLSLATATLPESTADTVALVGKTVFMTRMAGVCVLPRRLTMAMSGVAKA